MLRNLANSSIRTEKRLYFKNLSRFSSSRSFWHFLSAAGFHKPSHSSSVPNSFSDPSAINNHFLDSLPSTSASPELISYYSSQACETSPSSSFTFAPFSLGDLFSVFKGIKLTSSNPYDISDIMILNCVPHCLDSLLHIFNSAVLAGSFPAAWKHSFVYPIPKLANATSLDSLRPISLTPFLSKAL